MYTNFFCLIINYIFIYLYLYLKKELLQLIAYQKRHLDLKESRIKDLEIYIDNLVVKIMETDPVILMNETYSPMKNKLYA